MQALPVLTYQEGINVPLIDLKGEASKFDDGKGHKIQGHAPQVHIHIEVSKSTRHSQPDAQRIIKAKVWARPWPKVLPETPVWARPFGHS